MWYRKRIAGYATPKVNAYPHLDALLGAYFHQDFDLSGNTLAEILGVYRHDSSEAERKCTLFDLRRFLSDFGQSDEILTAAVQRVFQPDVIIEGWEGHTTRQWLEEVARLLC